MNRKKLSHGLTSQDVRALQHLWIAAQRARCPLTVLLTVNPRHARQMTAVDVCDLRNRILNLYGSHARRNAFKAFALWVRERPLDSPNEHIHMLLHVPKASRAGFIDHAMRWMPHPEEIDVRPANYRIRPTLSGKLMSAIHYLCKNMTPQAAYRRPYIRTRGGNVLGKRWGATRDLKALLLLPLRASGTDNTKGAGKSEGV